MGSAFRGDSLGPASESGRYKSKTKSRKCVTLERRSPPFANTAKDGAPSSSVESRQPTVQRKRNPRARARMPAAQEQTQQLSPSETQGKRERLCHTRNPGPRYRAGTCSTQRQEKTQERTEGPTLCPPAAGRQKAQRVGHPGKPKTQVENPSLKALGASRYLGHPNPRAREERWVRGDAGSYCDTI